MSIESSRPCAACCMPYSVLESTLSGDDSVLRAWLADAGYLTKPPVCIACLEVMSARSAVLHTALKADPSLKKATLCVLESVVPCQGKYSVHCCVYQPCLSSW